MIFGSKISRFYLYSHIMLLFLGLYWYVYEPGTSTQSHSFILNALLVYSFIVLLIDWVMRIRLFNTDDLVFVNVLCDALLITFIVRLTGGFYSQFYLCFFPVAALAAIVSVGWRSVASALLFAFAYLMAVFPVGLETFSIRPTIFRLLSILCVGFVSYVVAHFMRSSEQKLLKTLNILNERTWELESSQAQLSNIYETTRKLSGILDLDQLLAEILNIAHSIFRFNKCKVYLSNAAGDTIFMHASLEKNNLRIISNPTPITRSINNLAELGDTSILMMHKRIGGPDKDSGDIDVPLISRGKIMGLMQVETGSSEPPSEKERHLLMIFANSTAVALDNSLLHKKTEELTITDALTELYNFRYFRSKLFDEARRADRYHQPLSLLMLDLDHFKKINDFYGHQTGNIVLKEISGIIRQCVRDVDTVSRYGGEEFMVILPQTILHDGLIIAERIRATVETSYFSNAQGQRNIRATISIGAASYPDGLHTMEQLLDKVDKALYKAKENGRNLVCVLDEEKTKPIKVANEPEH